MNHKWEFTPLGEILKERIEKPSYDDLASGRVKIIDKISFRTGQIHFRSDGKTKTGMILVHPGDLVVSGINAAKGAIAVHDRGTDGPVAATIHYGSYIPNKDRVSIHFLWWMLRSKFFQELLLEYVPGGIKTELKAKRLLPVPIPLPPLPEQRRIVAQIEELAGQIQEARNLRQKATEEAEAIVASKITHIFEKGLTKKWFCGKLGDFVVDDCYGTSEKTMDDISGIPILRMGNIQHGKLNIKDLKYLYLSEKDRLKLILRRGDIFVNRTNSAELVGKCAVFDLEGDFSFASYLIRIRLDQNRAVPNLIAAFINSPKGRAFMFNQKKQMTGQANVNATKLKSLPIVLPLLPEQRSIVSELDALQAEVDSLKRLQAETATEMDALLPAILDRAFKGEL
jgi:type I restriction enzyme, S subunit